MAAAIKIMNPAESIKGWAQNAKQFYSDVRSEMRKVTWPGRQEVMGTTVVVIVAVFFFGFYLFLMDSLVGYAVTRLFHHFGIGGA
jgi:preprotein translocase subunit SecE